MINFKLNNPLKFATIIILCYGCYGSFLNGNFVFDDSVAIVRNVDVINLKSPIVNIFKHDFWGFNLNDSLSHKSYRPLTTISFRLQNELLGLSPYRMKAINLLLHILISCLLLFVYGLLISGDSDTDENTSLIAAALFAVHPIHTEAVCGIVGHAELLSSLFFLVAFIAYSAIVKENRKINLRKTIFFYIVFIACTILGLLSKENGITILPLCVFYDLVSTTNLIEILKFETNKRFIIKKASIFRLCFLIIFTIILIIWRLSIMNFKSPIFKPMDNPVAASDNMITRILSQNYLYALNFWLLMCPDWLSFDWALNSIKLVENFTDARVLSIICFYILCFGLIFNRNKTIYLGFGIIIITFLPASGIIRVGFVIAERILYLPSIGFCFLIAVGAQKLSSLYPSIKNIILFNLILLIILWVLRTRNRSYEWTNEKLLFTSALRVCPNNAKIYYNIARLAADNDRDMAFEYYHKAIRLYPDYESATMNLGNLYREIGDYSTAWKYLKRSVEILEEFPAAWMNLGIIESLLGNYEESLNCYRKALKYRKNYATCYYNMGNLFIVMKNSTMALKCWRETITLNPKQQKAWANILALLDNKGLTSDVIRTSETALMHIPNDPAILFTRANAFGKLGDFVESERIFKQIIEIRPNHALYHANLGVLYHRWGKTNLAIEHYENALTIDPNLNSAKENLKSLRNKIMKNHLN